MTNKYATKFLIAAANSGAGKTTLTLGLLRAIADSGKLVQPFKCGPDYIDTKLHQLASHSESINLDLFLSSESHVKQLFNRYSSDVDVSIVEGVMGLFDGYKKMEGSAAQIAEVIDCPIILVVNAKASAYSVAALLYGFKHFYQRVNIAGVIFNFVGSESHYQFLKAACEDVGVESLGYLPNDSLLEIPSRHLGLVAEGSEKLDEQINYMATVVEKYIDIDRLLEITRYSRLQSNIDEETNCHWFPFNRVAIAHDAAFNFIYPENIKVLQECSKVISFSPLEDESLPSDIDFIYFPGGYPELYAEKLSKNTKMMELISHYVEAGGYLYAECGGFIYLSSKLKIADDEEYKMVGIFNQEASMIPMKLNLGYRTWTDAQGNDFKGHEFHYSHIDSDLPSLVQQFGARGQQVSTKLVRYKNSIGGYTHLYWAEKKNILELFNL